MPKVTIAIPFYNAEDYFESAILSVLTQTFSDFILLLINDGSTDSSLSIAQKYLYDKRVKLISDGKNINLGNRLNQIPLIVDTEFLARMDADDIMHPKRIEKQLNVFEENPDIDVLGTNVYSIDQNDQVVGLRRKIGDNYLETANTFIHPTVMAKTEWFKSNPYDVLAYRIEDTDLWLRTKDKYNFRIITEPLLFYREVGDQYYKKYIKGLSGVFYIIKTHTFSLRYLSFSLKYLVSTFIYLIFNLLGLEEILVKKRNKVQLEKKRYSLYINLN